MSCFTITVGKSVAGSSAYPKTSTTFATGFFVGVGYLMIFPTTF